MPRVPWPRHDFLHEVNGPARAAMSSARRRGIGILALLLSAPLAIAQQRAMPPGMVIGPDGQPQPAQGQGGPPTKPDAPAAPIEASIYVPSTTQPANGKTAPISLNFKDASVDAVLNYLADSFGFTIIKEAKIDGRVTIQTGRAVAGPEAVAIVNSVLRIHGYALIQQGRELHVLPRAKAKKSDLPVHVGIDPKDIEATDELITQIIPLVKTDAVRLKQDLQTIISPDADLTANRDNNALVLTDISRNVKRVVQIVAELDRQGNTSVEMRIVRLKHADATATAKMIGQVFKGSTEQMNPQMMMMMQQQGRQVDGLDSALRGGRAVVAVPDDRTSTIVITGPGDSLKIVDQMIESLDSNETVSAEVRIFTLKFADADVAAKLVTDMFKAEEKDNNPYRIFFFGMQQQDTNGKPGKVIATADFRTGTLIVTAAPLQMKIIAEVLEKIDSDHATESAFFLHRLKNGQAVKLQLVLNTIFGVGPENGNNGQQQQFNNGQQGNFNGQQNGNGSAFGGRGRSGLNNNNGALGSGNGGTGIGSRRNGRNNNNSNNRPNLPAGSSHMIGEMAGQVFVVADEDTNSLLVTTASKYREQVKQIIEELDRPVPQVLIKVLVAEVTHDNSDDLGVDFSILNRRANGRKESIGSSLGNAALTGGLVVNLVENDINVTLHALASAGKLDVLSRPYILASDNQLASITVGQEVPFITDTRIETLGGQINTIQYQDVGIILQVTPHINPDGLVILDVTPEISQLTTSTVPISAGVSAPIISKRSADSRVGIRDGQTIVIGGLMEDKKISTVTKIPLLGDIPFIGGLFQRNQVQKSKTELLIFLTPHVAQQPENLRPMSQDELKGTKLTPNAVAPGMFDEQIRGLQRGAGPATQKSQ
jgi:general secretion pathway protein D